MHLLPAEARILFLALAPDDARDEAALAPLATPHTNWRLVTHLAERERLLSVLWYGLRDVDVVPREMQAAIRRRTAVIEFRMAATRARLEQIVSRLAAEGIPSLLLKGAALASSVYPSFAHRPMNDLDVLVPADDAARAWQHVRALGWTPEQDGGAEFHEAFHHLKPLVDPSGSGIVVEIHRSMMPRPGPFVLANEEIWSESTEARLGGASARVPSDLHQLLHLSVHFAWSHYLAGGLARAVRDVAHLTARRDIDWDKFLSLARSARASTCAFWTLRLSKSLGAARVPDPVLRALRPPLPHAAIRTLERAYVTAALFDLCPSLAARKALWTVGVQPRRSGHGAHRPWQVTERFRQVFHEGPKPPLPERVRGQLRRADAWLRFARAMGGGSMAS
ncbi:MAG TPA: nucleotidyltransferase family protein [Gemmatimonadaceae bacterium]|nr:nucleotidyltransferase family protein [Gemmatimonadaceae bacterium]